MSTESLNRTSNEIKIPDTHLDVLSKDKIEQNKKKREHALMLLIKNYMPNKKKTKLRTHLLFVL